MIDLVVSISLALMLRSVWALVLGTLNESSGLTDERVSGGGSNDSVGLTTLATSGVVASVGHVLVDSERFTSDGGLVNGDERDTGTGLNATILVVLILLLLKGVVTNGGEVLLVGLEVLGLVVVTDQANIGGDNGTFLDNDL